MASPDRLDFAAKHPFNRAISCQIRCGPVAVEIREIRDKEQWLAWRREFITASRIGGLPAFRCHFYHTPLRIYAELAGVQFPSDDDNPVLRRGRWLEPAVARAVSEMRPEWELEYPNVFLCDPEIGIGATPDYYIKGDPRGRGVLQIKTVAWSVWEREWNRGSEIPLWVTLQALTEGMLADAAFMAVAVMLVDAHNMDVKILDVPRHIGAEAKLVAEVRRFMDDVRNGVEPDPDFERDGMVLKLLLPHELPGSAIDLVGNNELPDMLATRAELRADIKRAQQACEAIENRVKFIMGEAAVGTGLDGWGISFKTQQRAGYTVEPSEPRVLLIRDKRPKEERQKIEDDDD